jgi:hypothetical protein
MNYNKEKIKLLSELTQLNVFDIKWLMKTLSIQSPEEERVELRKTRKEKLNKIFDDVIR